MAAFLFRLKNPNAPKPVCTVRPFTDVAVGSTFCGEITWLAEQGITTGENGKFKPADAVSRQAMAAFLYRLTGAGEN
ncbi:S-layer homology domain-containing protein [Nakamurella silvestris]|nr:S-layer homology domain-containing protein [Nakamurella silvestris]